MGLDMFLYEAKKLSDKRIEEIKGKCSIEVDGVAVFPINEDTERLCRYIMPCLRKARMIEEYIDIEKVKKDFEVSGYPVFSVHSAEETTFGFENGTATFRTEDYIAKRESDFYVCEMTECGYWRKAYDLQDDIYEAFREDGIEVENTGYYPLTEKAKEIIRDYGGYEYLESDDGIICYHEWY